MHTDLFHRMCRIRQLAFSSQSGVGSQMGWNHHGAGTTEVSVQHNDIYFDDAFVLDNQRPCRDKKRWRFVADGIEFHHFREQRYTKIFAFMGKDGQFQSLSSYSCPPDNYNGHLLVRSDAIVLTIAIAGARKNEQITYVYRS